MNYRYIVVTQEEGVGSIRLNRPETRNALAAEMREELLHALQEMEREETIRCIVLSGEGKAFSAGGDLKALQKVKPLEGRKRLENGYRLLFKILEIEKPIIAAVHGAAAGAGCNLALACDLVVAAEDSFFVQSFVNVGLIPDFGGIHFLPLLIGDKKAKEFMFLGEKVSAGEAYRLNLVNELVPPEEHVTRAMDLAEKIARKPPVALGLTKKLLNRQLHEKLRLFLELEAAAQDLCLQTEDFQEGVQAFFEKRVPKFQGR